MVKEGIRMRIRTDGEMWKIKGNTWILKENSTASTKSTEKQRNWSEYGKSFVCVGFICTFRKCGRPRVTKYDQEYSVVENIKANQQRDRIQKTQLIMWLFTWNKYIQREY